MIYHIIAFILFLLFRNWVLTQKPSDKEVKQTVERLKQAEEKLKRKKEMLA